MVKHPFAKKKLNVFFMPWQKNREMQRGLKNNLFKFYINYFLESCYL